MKRFRVGILGATGTVGASFNAGVSEGLYEVSFTTPSNPAADVSLYFRYQDSANWLRVHGWLKTE